MGIYAHNLSLKVLLRNAFLGDEPGQLVSLVLRL